MVVKFVEMHLPLGCFVDFLWLRAGRNARLSRSVDSGSCLCHMWGATMLFAVSQISQRLLLNATDISHSYFVWIFLSALALALLYVIVMFAALVVLHFTHSMTSHRMLPFPLPRIFSYAFTRNFCGWQLVQNYCSEKVSRFLFSPSSFSPSVARFSFTLKWKNLWEDKLSSAKVRAEF